MRRPTALPPGGSRPARTAAALACAAGALVLSGCAGTTASGAPTPSAPATPYSPPTPRATDALTLSQAVAAMLHERRVPVDGLDCSPTGSSGTVTTVRCVVTTGADDPDRIATVRWHRDDGAVEVVSLD